MSERDPDTRLCPAAPWAARIGHVLVAVVVLAGCEDSPTAAPVDLVAEEVGGALALGVDLPSPGAVAGDAFPEDAASARQAWDRSWDLPSDLGRFEREAVYAPLARALSSAGRPRIESAVARLGAAVVAVTELGVGELPRELSGHVERAAAAHRRAARSLMIGDLTAALEETLRGSDALREVGPRSVAEARITEAEEILRRVSEQGAYSPMDLERSKRLLRGARSAMEGGDFARAIRRAYYAARLLDPGA